METFIHSFIKESVEMERGIYRVKDSDQRTIVTENLEGQVQSLGRWNTFHKEETAFPLRQKGRKYRWFERVKKLVRERK